MKREIFRTISFALIIVMGVLLAYSFFCPIVKHAHAEHTKNVLCEQTIPGNIIDCAVSYTSLTGLLGVPIATKAILFLLLSIISVVFYHRVILLKRETVSSRCFQYFQFMYSTIIRLLQEKNLRVWRVIIESSPVRM